MTVESPRRSTLIETIIPDEQSVLVGLAQTMLVTIGGQPIMKTRGVAAHCFEGPWFTGDLHPGRKLESDAAGSTATDLDASTAVQRTMTGKFTARVVFCLSGRAMQDRHACDPVSIC
jgi:hypothetical protein